MEHIRLTDIMPAAPGDRWELYVPDDAWRSGQIPLEPALANLLAASAARVVLDTPQGQVLVAYDSARGLLHNPSLRNLADRPSALALECESTNPWSFRLTIAAPGRMALPTAQTTTDAGVLIAFALEDAELLQRTWRTLAPLRDFHLSLRASGLAIVAEFDTLRCLPLLRDVELLDHQLNTARTVLRRMRGRALLCDEVGLGKTIEAGMILLELVMRGLARRTLILTPPALVEQWQGELRRKFGLDSVSYDDLAFREQGAAAWAQHERIIASYHTAKREPHRSAIQALAWDMVVIDEVHHFRNRQTVLWQFASSLRKQYTLLLTATPVQNSLDDLFNLVALLQPELLSTARSFQRQFVDRRDKLTPRNVEQLHGLLSEVMVRNRRATVGRSLPHRLARTETVALSAAERDLYDGVSALVRARLRDPALRSGITRMTLLTLQKALGSSTPAAAPMIERLALAPHLPAAEQRALSELAATARQLEQHAKIDRMLTLLHTLPDKLVIFTQFRETQALIQERLAQAGEAAVPFHGGLSRLQKEEAIRLFEGSARVLVSTDAGSEGRNLQFCNVVCNFDLPWNPMRIEQRVGRLSRIGQTRDVHVLNLVAAGTLEAALLYLLDAKIAMFELVIGEIDMILGNLDEEREFEDLVTDLWVAAPDTDSFHGALDRLGDRLAAARDAYLRQRAEEDRIFGDRFAPDT